MDLSDAEELAKRLIASHLGPEWGFRWDHAKTRLGACHHHSRTISLSRHYARLNGEAETRDTILHEIAHALTAGTGHGPSWKKMAARLGARPSPRADPRQVVRPAPRWVAVCSACATTLWRYRRPTAAMACARCCRRHNGGRFDPAFLLHWNPVDPLGGAPPAAAPRADRSSPSTSPSPSTVPGSSPSTGSGSSPSAGSGSSPSERPAARAARKAPQPGPPAQLDLFTERS
ncbi:MAG: SprT-like domain-containing protein [Acidimicrobiaceae bacterium]|nr:SprT-like domain-containing protein [Acidimicrobiaceae bacterium]